MDIILTKIIWRCGCYCQWQHHLALAVCKSVVICLCPGNCASNSANDSSALSENFTIPTHTELQHTLVLLIWKPMEFENPFENPWKNVSYVTALGSWTPLLWFCYRTNCIRCYMYLNACQRGEALPWEFFRIWASPVSASFNKHQHIFIALLIKTWLASMVSDSAHTDPGLRYTKNWVVSMRDYSTLGTKASPHRNLHWIVFCSGQ